MDLGVHSKTLKLPEDTWWFTPFFAHNWGHNVLILALRWSFLSHCGKLFRIVLSITIDGCSSTTGSKDALLLADWARICCSNRLAPRTTSFQLHCMGDSFQLPCDSFQRLVSATLHSFFQNCFHILWWLVETMTVNIMSTEGYLLLEKTHTSSCLLLTHEPPTDITLLLS